MMCKNMVLYIYEWLRYPSGKLVEPFGGFRVLFVVDFQNIPPVVDNQIYINYRHPTFTLYHSINHDVFLDKI